MPKRNKIVMLISFDTWKKIVAAKRIGETMDDVVKRWYEEANRDE